MRNLIYPVIISEYHDDGHYYVATSPNIPGMVTQGDTFSDLDKWLHKNSKTIKKTITVPEYLSVMAKEQNINVSQLTTKALKAELGIQ